MVSQESEWLVVNSIFIDGPKIVVGATNSQRWEWDKKAGLSGADARTIVWVTLTDNGPNYVVREEVELFCVRKDPLRKLALGKIPDLFEIAWAIREKRLDNQQAQEAFFGYQLR
jgi:hypothetical protein